MSRIERIDNTSNKIVKVKEDKVFERWYCGDCEGTGRVWVKSHGAFGENDSYWGSCHCDTGFIYKERKK